MDQSQLLQAPVEKPKKLDSVIESCKYLLDVKENKILGRSWCDFLRLVFFYCIFYACLASLFVICMLVFIFFNVMQDSPKVNGPNTPMDFNPGLSIVPMTDYLTTLIRFKPRANYTFRRYTDDLVAFTLWYESIRGTTSQESSTLRDCKGDPKEDFPPDTRSSCMFDMNNAGPCNRNYFFGYHKGSPCVLVKLNQVYGWLPDPMPNATGVGIKCQGVDASDDDAMGELCYYDTDYLKLADPNKLVSENCVKNQSGKLEPFYFPYLKQSSYMNPVVFVQFRKPKKNVVIMVECHAIAKNIRVNGERRIGSVRFEMLID